MMIRRLLPLLLATIAIQGLAADSKTFDATYIATVKDVPAGVAAMKVWIPLPVSRGGQVISNVHIESPNTWMESTETTFGDRYAFATITNPPAGDFAVKVHFHGTRNEVTTARLAETSGSQAELQRALKADKLVTLSPRVRKLASEVTAGKTTPTEKAHAIYDYLLATMKYDKTIPGWGHGDTERACDIKAGNCTDFHSLFMSMARAEGIPARFVIGFPMTSDHTTVTGYHCWAEFFVKGKGWIPVDPSEASKTTNAARRAYLFGNLDPDRVQFTMGRDLVLTPRTAEPLNYFIYPHAEVDGKEVGTPAIALEYVTVQPATQTSAPARPHENRLLRSRQEELRVVVAGFVALVAQTLDGKRENTAHPFALKIVLRRTSPIVFARDLLFGSVEVEGQSAAAALLPQRCFDLIGHVPVEQNSQKDPEARPGRIVGRERTALEALCQKRLREVLSVSPVADARDANICRAASSRSQRRCRSRAGAARRRWQERRSHCVELSGTYGRGR